MSVFELSLKDYRSVECFTTRIYVEGQFTAAVRHHSIRRNELTQTAHTTEELAEVVNTFTGERCRNNQSDTALSRPCSRRPIYPANMDCHS